MFPKRFFPGPYFAKRYFAQLATVVPGLVLGALLLLLGVGGSTGGPSALPPESAPEFLAPARPSWSVDWVAVLNWIAVGLALLILLRLLGWI